jgi:UDP-N-acetylglucosamine 4,6-dehydratase
MQGGEIFVPKIPSMNIMDLVKAIAPKCQVDITGIRPGEKLHEVLITHDDSRSTMEYADRFVIEPQVYRLHHDGQGEGVRVKENFSYRSNNNPDILSVQDLRRLIYADHPENHPISGKAVHA